MQHSVSGSVWHEPRLSRSAQRRDVSARHAALVRPRPCAAAADPAARASRADEIDRRTRSLWRYRAALPMQVGRADHHGRGLHAAAAAHAARRAGAAEMRVVHADRQLQGSRRQRDAVAAARAGRRARCWRTVPATAARRSPPMPRRAACRRRSWRRPRPVRRRPCRCARMAPTVELIPGTRQDTADAAVRAVGDRLLRQPQLAPVLPARHQDAGLRAVGGSGLPRAGQRHRAVRRRLERAGLRDRLLRTAARRRDRSDAAHLRRPAGELRADRRGVPAGTETRRCRPRSARRSPRAPPSPSRSACRRCSGTLRETRGGAVMLTEAEIAAAMLDLARIGIYVEPTCAQVAAAFAKLLATGTIAAGADDGAGADRQRAEGDAAHRRAAGDCAVSGPRIALLGFSIECNRFAPVATEADFASRTLLCGEAMLDRGALPRRRACWASCPGSSPTWTRPAPWQPVPILLAMAEPNGPVEHGVLSTHDGAMGSRPARGGPAGRRLSACCTAPG